MLRKAGASASCAVHGRAHGGDSGRDVGRAHQFGNKRAAFRAVAGHFRDVMLLDAADGDKGQADVAGHPVQIVQGNRSADVPFRPRGENRPHADVVRARGRGGAKKASGAKTGAKAGAKKADGTKKTVGAKKAATKKSAAKSTAKKAKAEE